MKTVLIKREEKELIESVERGEWVPVKKGVKDLQCFREAARETLRKDARINIKPWWLALSINMLLDNWLRK